MLTTSAENWLKGLKSRFAAAARRNRPAGRRSAGKRRRLQSQLQATDALEDRIVMSANVLYDHPGTTFDADLFEENIVNTVDGNVVGYGYSISVDGSQGPDGGNGFAVAPVDLPPGIGGVLFDADTRIEVASVSKNITAVALLNVLESHPFATLDSPIDSYLPLSWVKGNSVGSISFRNLLTHTSGFGEDYSVPTDGTPNSEVGIAASLQVTWDFNSFGNNDDSGLRDMVAYGVQNTYADRTLDDLLQIGDYQYSNANYALMRLLIPRLSGDVGPSVSDPQEYADGYRDYVLDNILEPAGIDDAALLDTALLRARVYRPVSVDPTISTPGADTGQDRTLQAGGFGWKLTPNELSAYLRYVFNEDTSPLETTTLDMMRDELAGFTPGDSQPNGNYGGYFGHEGSFSNRSLGSTEALRRRMQSAVVVFPNDVQASLIVNSNSIPSFSPSNALQNAYDNSFTEVAIAGTMGSDTFTVSVSGGTLILTIDEGNDGMATPDEVFTAPIAVLEKLTLLGRNGDDTFIINQLPEDLELVINAGRGSDTLELTPGDSSTGRNLDTIADRVTFYGGPVSEFNSDVDTINIHDNNNSTSDTYYVTSNWFDKSGFDRLNYQRVEKINLVTGSGNDTIRVNSLPSSIALTVDSGAGNDNVFVGAANLSGNIHGLIDVVTGIGSDHLILDDRNGTVADDFYVIQDDYFQSSVIPVIEWDNASPPERITLHGSNQNSTTNIQGVLPGVVLTVHGNGGNDTINLHSVDAGGRANLYGGSDNDTIEIAPTGRDLDAIQGRVFTSGQDGMFDRVVIHDEDNTADGRSYQFRNNWFDVLSSPFDRLFYTGTVETVELQAGNNDDTIHVRSTSTTALVSVNGNGGSDTLNVAAADQDLDVINGPLYFSGGSGDGIDSVVLNDQQDYGNDSYTLTTDPPSSVTRTGGFQFNHFGVEDLTLNANDYDNNIVIGGSWALQTTAYTINASHGRDTVIVNASAPMHVTVNGDEGSPDYVYVRGTLQDDTVTVSGNELQLGATTVVFGAGIERRILEARGGHDLLIAEGRAGVNEHFTVQASTTAGSGTISATTLALLAFTNLEDVEVNGNETDSDRLSFRGTAQNDSFIVNPVAEGTATRPVVSLRQTGGSTLLNLRDFSHVGIPTIYGLAGADTFRVNVFPTQPEFEIRDIRLDGGTQPLVRPGRPQTGDTLIVNYNENLFTQLPSSIGPTSGRIRLGHDNDVLDILYRNFEELSGNLDLPF